MQTPLRVTLVEDVALVREGIARLLADDGIDVVAKLPDATGLLGAVRVDRPDVVVIDVRMPPTHTTEGLRASVDLKRAFPDVGVVVLSKHVIETRDAAELLAGDHTGVGYLLKERVADPAELTAAVRRVAAGETVVDPEVKRIVFETPRRADPVERLTPKEREVLALLAEGDSNERIAERLEVSARTVETHTNRIFDKLDLEAGPGTNRRVLAVLAHLRAAAPPGG